MIIPIATKAKRLCLALSSLHLQSGPTCLLALSPKAYDSSSGENRG